MSASLSGSRVFNGRVFGVRVYEGKSVGGCRDATTPISDPPHPQGGSHATPPGAEGVTGAPPRGRYVVRRYGLYSSRGRGTWKAWARLPAKVYELDIMACPRCGSRMEVIAVIQDPAEIRKIISCRAKHGRGPPTVGRSCSMIYCPVWPDEVRIRASSPHAHPFAVAGTIPGK
jgi:hypothetical protein